MPSGRILRCRTGWANTLNRCRRLLTLVEDLPSSLTISGTQERRAFPWETSSIALTAQSRVQRRFQQILHPICFVQRGGTSTSTAEASSEFEAIHSPTNPLIRHCHMLECKNSCPCFPAKVFAPLGLGLHTGSYVWKPQEA